MNRRAFLQSAAAGLATATLLGSKGSCSPGGRRNPAAIIDAHCHIFNATDLAIAGFIKHSALHISGGSPLDVLIVALDYQLQTAAPSFDEENSLLDSVLQGHSIPREFDATGPSPREFEDFLIHVTRVRPDLLRHDDEQLPPGFGKGFLFNALHWVWILTRYRLHIMQIMFKTFPEVELFVPAIVDMDLWLDDRAATAIPDQIKLYEKLIRISRGKIRPFAPFDPRRQIEAERNGVATPLDWVQGAVMHRGFAGVKLYPPMGFRAEDNADLDPQRFYAPLDDALDALYDWCQRERVPILAHAEASWGSQPGFAERAGPQFWRRALERFPELRISFGHFGGDRDIIESGNQSWAWEFAALMQEFPGAFADVAYHDAGFPGGDASRLDTYFAQLNEMVNAYPAALDKLMYGSDWHMTVQESGSDQYFSTIHDRFTARLPEALPQMFGKTARHWLVLDDPNSPSNKRLAALLAHS